MHRGGLKDSLVFSPSTPPGVASKIEGCGVVSLNRGPQLQLIINLIVGTPKTVPLVLGKPPLRHLGVQRAQRATSFGFVVVVLKVQEGWLLKALAAIEA